MTLHNPDIEIDFPETARRKAHAIRHTPQINSLLTPPPAQSASASLGGSSSSSSAASAGAAASSAASPTKASADPLAGCVIEVMSVDLGAYSTATAASAAGGGAGGQPFGGYSLVGADLRNLAQVTLALRAAGCDFSLPTLFISECVLVYLQPHESRAVIEWAAQLFGGANGGGGGGGAVFITYEQILPWDAFGQTMVKNLASRGCPLLSLEAVPDLPAQCKRYLDAGWTVAAAWDMNEVYKYFLNPSDLQRIEALEMFDEFEEWHIIQGHYSIAMAALIPAAATSSASGSSSSSASATDSKASAARAAAIAASPLSRIGLLNRAKQQPAAAVAAAAATAAQHHVPVGQTEAAALFAANTPGGSVVDPIASKLAVIEAYKKRAAAAAAATKQSAASSAGASAGASGSLKAKPAQRP